MFTVYTYYSHHTWKWCGVITSHGSNGHSHYVFFYAYENGYSAKKWGMWHPQLSNKNHEL
jgi:hypothetical protein